MALEIKRFPRGAAYQSNFDNSQKYPPQSVSDKIDTISAFDKEYVFDEIAPYFGLCKSLYIDNSANPSHIDILISDGNVLFFPKFSSGTIPVYVPQNAKIRLTSSGGGGLNKTIIFNNFASNQNITFAYGAPAPSGNQIVSGVNGDGTPPTAYPVLIGGFDGTNVQTLKTNALGQMEFDLGGGGLLTSNTFGTQLGAALLGLQTLSGIFAQLDDVSTSLGNENALSVLRMAKNRALLTQARTDSAAVSSVGSSLTAVTLAAANVARTGLTLFNNSTSEAYVKWGAGASSSSFSIKMAANSYYELPFGYIGQITAAWAAVNGSMLVTEGN